MQILRDLSPSLLRLELIPVHDAFSYSCHLPVSITSSLAWIMSHVACLFLFYWSVLSPLHQNCWESMSTSPLIFVLLLSMSLMGPQLLQALPNLEIVIHEYFPCMKVSSLESSYSCWVFLLCHLGSWKIWPYVSWYFPLDHMRFAKREAWLHLRGCVFPGVPSPEMAILVYIP